ncbi:MAG: hypothetical protein MOB07_16865 [Acidobacteria bacterium]|nr:hypothetical protein [Acidobacteriota bacterium]
MKYVSIKLISAIAIFALTFSNATSSSSGSPIPGQKEKNKADKEKQFEGIDLDGKRATLKKGYVFVNRTGNKVSVARQNTGGGRGDRDTGIKGTIECACGSNSKCGLTITGNILVCHGDECCHLIVVIAPQDKPQPEK